MIVVSQVTVNHDGQVVWRLIPFSGIKEVGRNVVRRIFGLILISHLSLGLLVSCMGLGLRMMVVVSLVRTLLRPESVSLLCKFVSFLGTLHWPSGAEDLGHFLVFPTRRS